MTDLSRFFEVSSTIRYVALYQSGKLTTRQRDFVSNQSNSESDRYEELFVNPAILTLARQRGNLDCGGLQFVVIRYGHFSQLVIDLPQGHLSICFELSSNPLEHVEYIRELALS